MMASGRVEALLQAMDYSEETRSGFSPFQQKIQTPLEEEEREALRSFLELLEESGLFERVSVSSGPGRPWSPSIAVGRDSAASAVALVLLDLPTSVAAVEIFRGPRCRLLTSAWRMPVYRRDSLAVWK
jgi:hypothetical protein